MNQRFSCDVSLEKIRVICVSDLETQNHVLSYQLEALLQSKPIRLCIVDSIAANYRVEGYTKGRSSELVKLSLKLKSLNRKYGISFIVVNQMQGHFGSSNLTLQDVYDTNEFTGGMNEIKAIKGLNPSKFERQNDNIPALGKAWTGVINTRILLEKDGITIK